MNDFDSIFDESTALAEATPSPTQTENKHSGQDYGNTYLNNSRKGLKLLADLVRCNEKPNNSQKKFSEISQLIENDFRSILELDTAPFSAKAWLDVQHALESLREVVSFPEIENRHIVALGGQFSAGKSRFINSLLGDSILPVDTNPTTAIPTYLYHSQVEEVSALNQYQHRTNIDLEALKAISHNFNCEDYQLTFSHILQLLTVQTDKIPYSNISFLDTPGYSKSDSGKTSSTDENIARDHLKRAHCLIWLVDISNGTVTDSDLKFLKSLDFHQPILFIFNKADKKTVSEIEEIIQVTKEKTLAGSELNVFDVIAYSSLDGKEYSPSGTVLQDYLKQIEATAAGSFMPQRFEKALDNFCAYHQTAEEENRSNNRLISNLMAHLPAEQIDTLLNLENRYKNRINQLQKDKAAVRKLKTTLSELLQELYSSLAIQILPFHQVQFRTSKSNKRFSAQEQHTFNASIQRLDGTQLDKLADHQKIPIKVTKVSASGISLIVDQPDIEADIFIMKGQITKAIGDHRKIAVEQKASMQYVSSNSAKVTFTI